MAIPLSDHGAVESTEDLQWASVCREGAGVAAGLRLCLRRPSDGRLPLPLLVPLSGYGDDVPFETYLVSLLGPLAPYLDGYLASGRLVLLLDGLNEMPQKGYAERVRRIGTVLGRFLEVAIAVTCRALDYVVPLEGLQKVEISPLHPERNTLKGCLRTEPLPMLSLCGSPSMLLMTAQVYAAARGTLPGNRARLFTAFVDTLLDREEKRLAGRWIPKEELEDYLYGLAYAMQEARGQGTTVERDWALE